MATASTPSAIEVGLSQLVTRSPSALPTGTRPEAMPPITAPSANGVRIEEAAKSDLDRRCSPELVAPGAQGVRGAAQDDADARR